MAARGDDLIGSGTASRARPAASDINETKLCRSSLRGPRPGLVGLWTCRGTRRNVTVTVDEPAVRIRSTLARPGLLGVGGARQGGMGVGSDLSPLRVRVSWDHLTVTVGVSGELGANTAPGLIEALLEVAITARPERFVQ